MTELVPFIYLSLLLVSILGLGAIDHRHKLALFVSPRATIVSVAVAVVVFLAWDLVGIALGIFFRGDELFFLILLSYNTLLVYQGFARRFAK